MSTKKDEQPGAGNAPTLVNNTGSLSSYYAGQLVTLLPTINMNGGALTPDNGTDLTVSVPSGAPGLALLPGVEYKQSLTQIGNATTWSPTWNGKPGLPVVIKGLSNEDPVWEATTDTDPPSVKAPLKIDPPPKLEADDAVPQDAFGQVGVIATTVILKGVQVKPKPGDGNTNQVQIKMPMLGSDKKPVQADSGPFVGYFGVNDSSKLTLDNLAFFDTEVEGGAAVLAPFKGNDVINKKPTVWPRSDKDGKFNIYIVPNDGTDNLSGWVDLNFQAGEAQPIPSLLVIIPPKRGFTLDSSLEAPRIAEATGGSIDLSYQSTFSVTLPEYVLENISSGTRALLMINGEVVENSVRPLRRGMDDSTVIFNFDATNPLLQAPALNQPPIQNTVQYVLIDSYGLRGSIAYVVEVYKSTGETPAPGPQYPYGNAGFDAPVVKELKGRTLTGADIVEGLGVHVEANWTVGKPWQPKPKQSVQTTIWLSGWHHGGVEVNQNTFSETIAITDPQADTLEFTFPMDKFADYGPPAYAANELPSMQVQYAVLDTDGKTVLYRSATLKISLDTIPAGD